MRSQPKCRPRRLLMQHSLGLLEVGISPSPSSLMSPRGKGGSIPGEGRKPGMPGLRSCAVKAVGELPQVDLVHQLIMMPNPTPVTEG